jgi:ComF family protein
MNSSFIKSTYIDQKINFKFHLDAFVNLFYPRLCYACSSNQIDNNEMICMECLGNLPYTKFESIKANATEKLFWGRIPTSFACSIFYFEKENAIQNIIHQIKYKNEKKLGLFMGNLMGLKLLTLIKDHKVDFMIPMPLHPKKEKKRGYNQATLLCKGIRTFTKLEYNENAIVRIQHTQTQTRKSRIERWQNVEHVFNIPNPEIICGKNILIIDDVITTGASSEACGQALLEAGANSISICGLAYTT